MSFVIDAAGFTSRGLIRRKNEDNLYFNGLFLPADHEDSDIFQQSVNTLHRPVFAIFDGMGGVCAGEDASYLAAYGLSEQWKDNEMEAGNVISDIDRLCRELNHIICSYAEEHNYSSFGTTAAILFMIHNKVYLCNLGDSRIYCLAKGKLKQLSKDHVLTGSAMRKPPLTQHLGICEEELYISPYIDCQPLRKGARYLLCSDGITDMLPDNQVAEIIGEGPVQEALVQLRKKIYQEGAMDNLSAILCEVKAKEKVGWWDTVLSYIETR